MIITQVDDFVLFCTQKVKADAVKAAMHAAESRREVAESPVAKIGGFQDFMAPSKASRKKRQLPIAPRSRDRATSQDEPESEEELI